MTRRRKYLHEQANIVQSGGNMIVLCTVCGVQCGCRSVLYRIIVKSSVPACLTVSCTAPHGRLRITTITTLRWPSVGSVTANDEVLAGQHSRELLSQKSPWAVDGEVQPVFDLWTCTDKCNVATVYEISREKLRSLLGKAVTRITLGYLILWGIWSNCL